MKRISFSLLAACTLLSSGCIIATNNKGESKNPEGGDAASGDGGGGSGQARPPRDTLGTRGGPKRTQAKAISTNLPPKDDWDQGIGTPIDGDGKAAPELTGFTPTTGAVGTAVEIFGANFGSDANAIEVSAGGVAWTVTDLYADRLVAKVPEGAKDGPIKVKVGKKSATTDGAFSVLADDGGFGTATGMNGLQGEVFAIPDSSDGLPAFDDLGEPHAVIAVPNLDVPTRDFTTGFPGVDGDLVEWFAIRFTGGLNITEEAEYELCLNSDDGSALFLEGQLVVNNDGVHATEEVCELVYLAPGEYRMELQYFQGPRTEIALQFLWSQNGGDKVAVPESALFRPQ